MTLDDKDKLKGNKIEVPFEGTLEIDPSSIEIEDDGSMSEPSFNSDEVLEDNDNTIDDDQTLESTENLQKNDSDDEEDEIIYDDLDDDLNDEEIIDDSGDDMSSDDQYFDESSPDSGQEVTESSSTRDSNDEKVQSDESKDTKKSEESESTSDNSTDSSTEDTSSSSTDDSSTSEDTSTSSDDEGTSSSGDSTDSQKDESVDNTSKETDSKQSEPSDNKNVDNKEPSGTKPEDTKDIPDKKAPEKPDAKDAAKEVAKDQAKEAKDAAKDAAKDVAKDAAKDTAKDVAKEAAKEGAKEGAKNAAKNSLGDKVAIASDTKDALSKGPKGLVGAPGIRAALAASANTNPYSKAGAIAVKVLDAILGKNKTDWLLDKLGEAVLRHTMIALVVAIIHALLPVMLLIIGIFIIFAPLLDALEEVQQYTVKLANTAEKFKNLYTNGIYGDSKEVFYEELKQLGQVYGDELDETLLLSTVFYSDMKGGYETRYDNIEDVVSDNMDSQVDFFTGFLEAVRCLWDTFSTESDSTYDTTTGLLYTTGRVYRLRTLSANMFSSKLMGDESDYTIRTTTIGDWCDMYGTQLWDTLKLSLKNIATSFGNAAAWGFLTIALVAAGFVFPPAWIAAGATGAQTIFETISSVSDAIEAYEVLLNCYYLGYLSIQSIDWSSVDSFSWENIQNVEIKYYSYKYNEENYKKFLKEKYIPRTSDFEKYLSYDKFGNPTEASIDRIINEIYEYRDYFEDIFYQKEEDYSENYSQLCLGAIDKKLAAAMSDPVDINTNDCIDFSGVNGYGYTSDNLLHNGIELNANSTGNQAGDKVYSVMDDGTIVHSSYDNTMECVGGCLEIEYDTTNEEDVSQNTFHFTIIYKGLSKDSVTLKTGDKVTNQQQVGVIGTAEESENMGLPSLYIEFRKENGDAIDPTNMIIKCASQGLEDYPNSKIVNIPQNFKQYEKYVYTCYGGKGFYQVGCLNPDETWGTAVGQTKVFNLWKQQGSRYKHDIAIVTVDGVDRYVAAVVLKVGRAGDVVNAKLADGSVIPLIIGDSKSHGSSPDGWGSSHGKKKETVLIEFEVDKQQVRPDDNKGFLKDNVSNDWGIEWDSKSPVVSFSNAGNIRTGNFDTISPAASEDMLAGNGLVACASLYSGSGSSNNPAESIPIHEILISKADFITATEKYRESVSCNDDCNTLLSQASDIYDISKKYNVNPELVVVRASREGYDPGASKNNYWGIGCVNKHPEKCKSYSSLDEGIKSFATKTVVKDSNTCAEMMSKYAYIGERWYNPGNWTDGGCAYFSYIKPYLQSSQDRISQIESACRSGNTCSGNSCLATDDNDQLAYGQYQCKEMNQLYKKIYLSYH